ncbi:VWA domain-containing protein [archaeon]|nr:VWA domain-containing protein [Nanoarchaeota archaeon]MBU4300297.1 VWA domain-containing protein [Nanoarchaeota archaeon]MCG2723195.1 VWA domain-containing protein [archaeon]
MPFNFFNPEYLILLAAIPIIYYFYSRSLKKKKKRAMQFNNLHLVRQAMKLSNHKPKNIEKILFIINSMVILLLILALADPHIPLKQEKKGVNVVLAIDVSGSMQANDYQPTRLEAAKKSAQILIDSLNTNDYVGIVTFSSGATTTAYLSPMKDRAKEKLAAISPQSQTAIGDGLALAVDMATSIPNKKKVVILLSDGVNNAGVISPEEAAKFAKDNKIQVYTIGVGSNQPAIMGYDPFGNPQYAQLDEEALKGIARDTGGEYHKSVDAKTLENIYSQLSEKIDREKKDTSIKDWFIACAIILAIGGIYLNYGKYSVIH